jgi:hypothetical protein
MMAGTLRSHYYVEREFEKGQVLIFLKKREGMRKVKKDLIESFKSEIKSHRIRKA